MKKGYRDLGVVVRESGVQVAFQSILLDKEKGFERASRMWQIKKWLQDWFYNQDFS